MPSIRLSARAIALGLGVCVPSAAFASVARAEWPPQSVVAGWDDAVVADGATPFDGFGLGGFQGAGSIAPAIRSSDVREPAGPDPFRVIVRGPAAPDQAANPLEACIKSRIEGIDLTAGMLADSRVVESGRPAKLLGGMAMAHDHDKGREAIELKTTIARSTTAARLSLELGPRVERRLPGGLTLFFDASAQAQSAPPQAIDWQPLAGPALDGVGLVGLTGRTGIAR